MTWLIIHRYVWIDIVSWQTRRRNNSTMFLFSASMIITSKKKKQNLLENCQVHALILFYMFVLGTHWTTWYFEVRNKIARSIKKYTKAWRLNRLISYIHHTYDCKQYCHVGNTAKQCRLGLFQDSDFAGDLEDSKSTSGGTLCTLGIHTFVPISSMCDSSTESEMIFLDIGLRLDELPALELWDLIVSVLGNVSRVQIGLDNQIMMFTNVKNLKRKSMWWKSIMLSFKCPIRASKSFIVCVWGQWSCDQNDY